MEITRMIWPESSLSGWGQYLLQRMRQASDSFNCKTQEYWSKNVKQFVLFTNRVRRFSENQWMSLMSIQMKFDVSVVSNQYISIVHHRFTSKAPFTPEQFSKGPLLNCNMVVKFYKMYLMWKQLFLLSRLFCKILSTTLLHFTTMLKLSKGPLLSCCSVKSTYDVNALGQSEWLNWTWVQFHRAAKHKTLLSMKFFALIKTALPTKFPCDF